MSDCCGQFRTRRGLPASDGSWGMIIVFTIVRLVLVSAGIPRRRAHLFRTPSLTHATLPPRSTPRFQAIAFRILNRKGPISRVPAGRGYPRYPCADASMAGLVGTPPRRWCYAYR